MLEITQKWREPVRYGVLLLLFLLTYLIVLRPIKKQMVRTLRAAEPEQAEAVEAELVETEAAAELPGGATAALPNPAEELAAVQASQEEAVSKQLKQILVERVTREPATASKLVQNWIRQDEASR